MYHSSSMISKFPQVEIGTKAVKSVVLESQSEGRTGADFEFDSRTNVPTIIGVSSLNRVAACYWDRETAEQLINAGTVHVGHAYIGADREVLTQATNIQLPLDRISDSMIRFWICNADLASTPKDRWGDDLTDGNAIGFMNLWSVVSMMSDLPHWKGVRSPDGAARCLYPEECLREARPCPEHAPLQYCGIDAYGGLIADYALIAEMETRGIPETYYRWRARVTEAYVKLSNKGVWADLDVIVKIQRQIDDRKLNIFPYRLDYSGKPRVPSEARMRKWVVKAAKPPKYTKKGVVKFFNVPKMPTITAGKAKKKPVRIWEGPFNPNSPSATWAWLAARGIELYDRLGKKSVGKEVLLRALKKRLTPYGLTFDPVSGEILGSTTTEDSEDLLPLPAFSDELNILIKLAQKTCASKGTNSWFNNKTKVSRDEISEGLSKAGVDLNLLESVSTNLWICRGRANSCGTSTSRIAMSRDNYTNLPKRGALAEVRKGIVARPGYQFIRADYAQLEFRKCLWDSGSDPALADPGTDGLDPFMKIVVRSDGQFEDAAARTNDSPRGVAKSIVHAADLLESLRLMDREELGSPSVVKARDAGALVVYDGTCGRSRWQYMGQTVTFTGNNIAERLFGAKTLEYRRKALALISIYVDDLYSQIREWQIRITHEAENTGFATIPEIGHQVRLGRRKGSYEDDLKFLMTMKAQGGGAVYATEGFLRFVEAGIVPSLFVHDEIVFCEEAPISWTPEEILAFFEPMTQESEFFPGFAVPIEVKAGPSWGETRLLGVLKPKCVTSGKRGY